MIYKILICILLPFIGTVIGSSTVYLVKKQINDNIEKLFLSIASGIMISASIWSLLVPAIDLSKEQNLIPWLTTSSGFMIGILFLLLIDYLSITINKEKYKDKKANKLMLAVSMHNIPEGMALGVLLVSYLVNDTIVSFASILSLSIGIAIQNFPEGAIISLPISSLKKNKNKAFLMGVLSGLIETFGSIITILLTNLVLPLLPYMLSFASGAMIYVVIEELLPSSKNTHSIIGVSIGFILMMILDII